MMPNFLQFILLAVLGSTVVWKIAADSVPGASTNVVCVNNLWTFNERQQSPCLVTAALKTKCNGGNGTLLAVTPGTMYMGPQESNLCGCNTIMYSVISACAACQQDVLVDTWPHWKTNCAPQNLTGSSYPLGVPSSVVIPSWAYLSVNVTWDITAAFTVHNSGASMLSSVSPGAPDSSSVSLGAPDLSSVSLTISTNTVSSPSPTSIRTGSPTPPSTTSSNKPLPTGRIAGGVVGGIAIIALLGLLGFVIHRRRAKITLIRGDKVDLIGTDSPSPPASNLSSQVPPRLDNPQDPPPYPPKGPLPVLPTA